jgi:hypothetical protein
MHICAEYLHCTREEFLNLPLDERLWWLNYATIRSMYEQQEVEKTKGSVKHG